MSRRAKGRRMYVRLAVDPASGTLCELPNVMWLCIGFLSCVSVAFVSSSGRLGRSLVVSEHPVRIPVSGLQPGDILAFIGQEPVSLGKAR